MKGALIRLAVVGILAVAVVAQYNYGYADYNGYGYDLYDDGESCSWSSTHGTGGVWCSCLNLAICPCTKLAA